MYSRGTGENELTFGVSGKLWHGVLVMYDRETDSLWTQLDGRSIKGVAHGDKLEYYPSVFTSWAAWRDAHPDTLVLDKSVEERNQQASQYASYFADPDRLFLPRLNRGLGDQVRPKQVVFGVKRNGDALAVTEELLADFLIVNTSVGGEPVALILDERTGGVRAVFRQHDGRVIELDPLPDDPGHAVDLTSGKTIEVAELTELRVDRAFWYAWGRTNPDSRALTLENYGE